MKKLLAVLLALAMVCGVGVCGTVGASAASYEEEFEVMSCIIPLLAYDFIYEISVSYSTYAEVLRGIAASTSPAAANAWLAGEQDIDAFLHKYDAIDSLDVDWDALTNAYVNGTLQAEVNALISSLDTLFANFFTPAFLTVFDNYKSALTKGWSAIMALSYRYEKERDVIANNDAIIAAMDAFSDWYNHTYSGQSVDGKWEAGLERTGDFAALTAFYLEMETRAKAIWDMIEYADPTPTHFWDSLPDWLVWILQYVLFGWLWMRWF